MAQPNDSRRTTTTEASNAPRPQNSPGTKNSSSQTSPHLQHLQGGASSWSPNSSPKPKKNHDQDDHGNHHNKKSVFMRVKEKARRLKKSLSGRRRRDENELHSPYITPPGSAGSVEDDDKERPEFFGSPSYEPRVTPETGKHSAKEQPREANNGSSKNPETPSLDSTDTMADSKLSGLTISAREGSETALPDDKKPEEKENTRSSMQPQDKGVSVKEYLMHKFEPGEDERALSQVITQTISPRCERMKEAMNSILGNEESSHDSISNSSKSELDITPSSSSIESSDKKLSSLSNHPNPSNTLEPDISNASNISQCPAPTSASNNLNSDSSANDTRNPASTSSHEDTKDDNS